MKRIHFSISILVGCISFFGFMHESLGLTYPTTTPAGEMSGGTYYSYFQNMFPGCTTGQVIQNFTSTGMPNCVTPAASTLSLSGQTLGDTIYFDGTTWISSDNIFNSGGAVSIGGVTPQSAFEVWSGTNPFLHFRGTNNSAFGSRSLFSNTTGNGNSAFGSRSLFSNTTGNGNSAFGWSALDQNSIGSDNSAFGRLSLSINSSGTLNTALGAYTLSVNSTGSYNTAIGGNALVFNIRGSDNTAVGVNALMSNTGGNRNTAVGVDALYSNKVGIGNISIGIGSAYNVLGDKNVAVGSYAIDLLSTGNGNVAIGYDAGYNIVSGSGNIALGNDTRFPLNSGNNQLNIGNSIFGSNIGTTTNQIFLGTGSLTTSNSSVVVKVNGNIQISGSGAGSGKILIAKDSNGLAEWGDVFASSVTSSGVVGGSGSYGYLIKFGSGGIGLDLSTLFETGGFLGIGTTNPKSFIEIAQSGALYMHFRGTNTVALGKFALNTLSGGLNNTAIGYGSLSGATTASYNIAIGSEALNKTTNSVNNIAIGSQALYNTLSGTENVAIGRNTLFSNTTGNYNTALGSYALSGNTSGTYNIGFGYQSLAGNSIGVSNIAFGYQSLQLSNGSYNIGIGKNTLSKNVSSNNIAMGDSTLFNNTNGQDNIGIGYQSLYSNDSGNFNIGIGYQTLYSNLSSGYNIGIGYQVMYGNTTGYNNLGIGFKAMNSNTSGYQNIAIGHQSLSGNTSGYQNVAIGVNALYTNSTGAENIAIGDSALVKNTIGMRNTAIGVSALRDNTTGDRNVDIGALVLANNTVGTRNIGIGRQALNHNESGSYNIALGDAALWTLVEGEDNIALGDNALFYNTGSSYNIGIGASALAKVLSGSNIAIGNNSANNIITGYYNVSMGQSSMKYVSGSSSQNIAIGPLALQGKSNGSTLSYDNIAIGISAMQTTILGTKNTAIGNYSMYAISDGSSNVAVGDLAMRYNVNGSGNVALGANALYSGLDSFNTAVGYNTLYTTQGGRENTALGYNAGYSNNAGNYNIALGSNALYSNLGGSQNIAIGYQSLYGNLANNYNIGIGSQALYNTTGGGQNVALGAAAMQNNIGGGANVAVGMNAMQYTASGNNNVALGLAALQGGNTGSFAQRNVALGSNTFLAAQNLVLSVAIGYQAGDSQTGGQNNVTIGYNTELPNLGGSDQLNIQDEIYGSGMGTSSPNIGINTNAPTATLDINGNMRMRTGAFSGAALLSNASGTAYWGSVTVGSVSASGITGGVQNYITKFGTGGNGLMSSLLFDNGTQVGIGTATPLAGTELDVTGDARFTGNVTVQGNLITDKIVNRTVTNVTISGSLLPDTTAPLTYRDIGTTALRWNNLYLSGQIAIAGGSPGLGKVLTSDANGLASWVTGFSGSYTSSGITGGTQYYVPKFGTGGNGLILSSIYDNGSIVGIGTSTATSRFEVWSGASSVFHMRGTNNIGMGLGSVRPALTGNANTGFGHESLYTLTTGYSNSAFGHQALRQSTAGFNNSAFGKEAMYNDGDGTWNTAFGYQALRTATSSDYNVAIGGQALYTLGTGQGNVAIGHNALYAATTTTSNNTAIGYMAGSGITTGQNNILIGYGVQAASNTASNQLNIGNWIYGSGGNIGIGTGGTAITAKLTIDSGVNNVSGIRIPRIVASTPVFTGVAAPLGVDTSGNVVISKQGAIPVYTAIGASQNQAINDAANPPTIGANYDRYFTIDARQSFAVTDVGGNPYNCPEFAVGSTNKGSTGCSQTPWATYVMTAQNATSGNRYAYQILISDRTDAPFVVRGGTYFSGVGQLMNTAGTNESLWFKALTVPTNHSDWLYVNPGVDANSNPIAGGGNIGIGTMSPNYTLDVRGEVGMMNRVYLTGTTAAAANPTLSFAGDTNMGIFRPAADTLAVSTAGTERMRIFSNGNVSIGSTTNSAKLRVEGQIMMVDGSQGAGKVLTSDANGLATWTTPSGGGSGASFGRYTYILGTAQNRTANSLADLGLTSVSLPVGTYNFKMIASYRTAATTTGIGFALVSNGAVIDRYVGQLSAQNNANSTDEVSSAVVGTALVSRNVPATGTDYAAIYQGTFRVTTAGGVKIQYQSEVNTSQVTVQPGANLIIEEV